MAAPLKIISGLSQVAAGYDALVCDVWGVVHNGRAAWPDACEALVRFRKAGGAVVLVSNSPRPSEGFTAQMRSLGVPDEAWDAVTTSGDATRGLLAERAPGPAWKVGPARDDQLYAGLDLRFAEGPEDAAFISCSGLFDDQNDQPEDYRAAFEVAASRKLEMICANPDRIVQLGDRTIWCAGALADVYESLGGKVLMAGKPCPPIYDLARKRLAEALGHAPERILAIGDGVATDVAGANSQGFDCLFIAGGIHGGDFDGGALDAQAATETLAKQGAHAAFAMGALSW
ncbi:MAG: TIGR01459 family HAD-type hydrolase [Caulobacteraceae bacterium]